jgi:hypothetical protein
MVEVAAVRPGGWVGEEIPLAAPAGDVELGLGEAAQPPPAGVIDRGTVLVELAGELANCVRCRLQRPVLAQPGDEAGEPAGVDGVQAEEFLGGAVAVDASGRDGQHHGEREAVAEEVEALGGHEAQRPARP